MKKIFSLLFILMLGVTLISCKKEIPEDIDTPIVISKVMTDPFFAVSGIEIHNPSNEEVDLKNHSIRLYQANNRNFDTTIELKGKLAAKGFYFIVHEKSEQTALDKADLVYTGRQLTGAESIELMGGKTRKDMIGVIGTGISYINQQQGATYMRREDRLIQRDVHVYSDYFELLPGMYEKLGTLDTGITEEDLIHGPILSDSEINGAFYLNNDSRYGGGGVQKVTVGRYNDGDTSYFNYPSFLGNSMSTRYYFIDTPETQAARIEPFGYPAANFTNNLLKDAELYDLDIHVGTPKGLSTDGSFGRYFGQVFVNRVSLSYLLLRNGLAPSASTSGEESQSNYKNMTYEGWMRQAEYYARENGLGVHGEAKDPSHFDDGTDMGRNLGLRPYIEKSYERTDVEVVKTEAELIDAISNDIPYIEVANDITLTKSLVIDKKSDITIYGFGNSLILNSSTENVLEVKNNANIYLDNIGFNGGKSGILVDNAILNIIGYIPFVNFEEVGINIVGESELKVGTITKDYIKDNHLLKLLTDKDGEALIKADSNLTINLTPLFPQNQLTKVDGENVWSLVNKK